MTDIEKQLQELNEQLHTLKLRQSSVQDEIGRIEFKLRQLQVAIGTPSTPQPKPAEKPAEKPVLTVTAPPKQTETPVYPPPPKQQLPKTNSALENFIGTNLISKIGILITIIGVFIGARYAIDRDLISPTTRIILSYVFAVGMAAVGLKLKSKYNAFSAVLIGGSIAIIYFSTFVGHGLYNLFPRIVAFIIMFITTILAVGMAIWYNQKIIALIGQVAAYAIPILLSDGSGKVAVLFTYISIINAGLMVLSFRKNWKIIYRIAFGITWSLYIGLLLVNENVKLSWEWSMFFITLCFLTFYITYLSYKIFKKELYNIFEVSVLLLNAVIYFFIGFILIDRTFDNTNVLTIFTIANALVHFVAGYGIHRLKLADTSVKLFLWGQALTFITVAIPVKLDGSWVTLLWGIEGAILIFTASKTQRSLYYQLGGIIFVITILSLFQDWTKTYGVSTLPIRPFLNQTFITSIIIAGCFLFASIKCRSVPLQSKDIYTIGLPIVFFILLYLGIFLEIKLFYHQLNESKPNPQVIDWLGISMLHFYSLMYVSFFMFINRQLLRKAVFFHLLIWCGVIFLLLQLSSGLAALDHLRTSSLRWVRYLNFSAIALLWWLAWKGKNVYNTDTVFHISFSVVFNITLLTLIGNEYIYWMRLLGSSTEYKLGMSILFGAYALVVLFRGLVLNILHLRIFAIVLFAITVIKLFAYDLRSLSTIGKTIVLIILGIILLAASFLYNKYVKKNISNEQ